MPPAPPPGRRVRFRLLPWRLRRRTRGKNEQLDGFWDAVSGVDDLFAAGLVVVLVVAGALVLFAPLLFGLALLPFELALVAVVTLGELLLRAVRVRPWTLAVEERRDDRWIPVERVQVKGLKAARRRRERLRAGLG